jgi:trans-aconitate methyltransferase
MTFEFDGKKYAEASSLQKAWGEKLISELYLKGNERILDLGCGDGALSARLADLVPEGMVLGIDGSRGMIEAARKHGKDNLSFMLRDINSLDFDADFHVVFSNAALHWIKDHRPLLEKVYRSLKGGGVIRFNFAGEGNCSHFFRVVSSAIEHERYSMYFSGFVWPWYMPAVNEYEVLIRQFPFREIKVWGENADQYFPDSEAMVKWIDQPSIVPFLTRVEESDKKAFRGLVVKGMIDDTLREDGTCFETFRRIHVYAKK